MGDKSPQNQIKIGNLTVKLNPNNQQKKRDSNYDRNYYYKKNDRYNDRNNDRDRRRDKDIERDRERDRERNKHQLDKNYNNKKSEYDNRKDRHCKNYSNSNSSSRSRRKVSSNRNHNRSRSRTHSHHKNRNNQNDNSKSNTNVKTNTNNNSNNNNNNINLNNAQNNNLNNNSMGGALNNNNINSQNNQSNTNNSSSNNSNNNMGFMNQINQNFFNNYINNEFFKRFYSMNNRAGNSNTNNIIVPIGIPLNYFYNPNMANMNQVNKANNPNSQSQNINNNSQNNQAQTQTHTKSQPKEEPSNTILITDLDTNITKETLEDIFREKCLKLQISMPVDIRLIEALNSAYIIFPSVTSCVIVYNSLINQKILINGKYFPAQFSPNLTSKYNNNRDTLTYVTQISSNTSLTTSMETTVHEDWYCVYCDSKNFSRRTVCFKCQKPKSINCRVVPVIKQKKIILGVNGEILPNNSIIIQGKQIQYSNEGEVLIFLLI